MNIEQKENYYMNYDPWYFWYPQKLLHWTLNISQPYMKMAKQNEISEAYIPLNVEVWTRGPPFWRWHSQIICKWQFLYHHQKSTEVGLFNGYHGELGNFDSGDNIAKNRQQDTTWKYDVSVYIHTHTYSYIYIYPSVGPDEFNTTDSTENRFYLWEHKYITNTIMSSPNLVDGKWMIYPTRKLQ